MTLSADIAVLTKPLAAVLPTHGFCCPSLCWLERCCSKHRYQKGPSVLVATCAVTTMARTPHFRWFLSVLGLTVSTCLTSAAGFCPLRAWEQGERLTLGSQGAAVTACSLTVAGILTWQGVVEIPGSFPASFYRRVAIQVCFWCVGLIDDFIF